MARPRTPAAHWSETPLARMFGPVQHFASQSQSGGIMLFLMTLVALGLANSPLAGAYHALLELHVGISIGPWAIEESLLYWINDGLMAIFFFVVGLEIKRELLVGELATLRAAALPIIAACGGALVPAAIYALANAGGVGASGWGVPMATDIAFALGCLALLGSRIPFALKIFVTAVAIVDDLIAVLVIAIFYSSDLRVGALAAGLAILLLLVGCNWQGIRNPLVYSVLGVLMWLAFLQSGVHATIAGVLIALAIPARYRIDAPTFHWRAHALLNTFDPLAGLSAPMLTDDRQQHAVLALEGLCEQVQAPLQKLEHQLQGWVTWLIMPVFALANAGIALNTVRLDAESLPMALGVVVGLVCGKPLGLLGATWLAVRSGRAELPQVVSWGAMVGAGVLAGIGFTMSIFIATLAFQAPDVLATIKLAILVASLLAGALGVMLLRRLPADLAG
ncbi:MAG: Na+/H+ antiporter NhaA [Chloroflexales bacterium]